MAYSGKQIAWHGMLEKKEQRVAFCFEGLEIFHAAIDLSARVHEIVKKFPSEERFDLTSQARRADLEEMKRDAELLSMRINAFKRTLR